MPVTFEISPAIGIARVGTSSDFFIGPEPNTPLDLRRRDRNGLLKQAARFRIYECDRDATGVLQSVREITSQNAAIEWSVHLVNRKAAAERFLSGPGASRRNNATGDDARDRNLIIDPGVASVSSAAVTVPLNGSFQGAPVSLGSIVMQNDGALCVIGGNGTSAGSRPIRNFADNDGWHDDVGDGPVTARVTMGGQTFPAKAAWVVVAPPDFAPQIENIVTMYDVLFDGAIKRRVLRKPPTIFYESMVRPILERARSMQWVNRQARLGYDDTQSGGHASGGPGDFDLDALGDPAGPASARQAVFRLLRDPDAAAGPAGITKRKHMPRLNDHNDTGEVMPLTHEQYRALKLWAAGTFQRSDPSPPLESEPDARTRVALQASAGASLFPGIEMGRIVWDASIYLPNEAFRFSPQRLRPGDVTARNAVPWQADFWQCRWEQTDGGREKMLAWWPGQRPDDVLTDATATPVPWARGIPDSGEGMVENWHRLGFVKEDPTNPGIYIEQERDPALPNV